MATTHWQKTPELPGRVLFTEGSGEMPRLAISTAWSDAELYLHGAQLTHFQLKNEPPVLYMSQLSRFEANAPIRGGIPVIFPWFGARESGPAHGFARLETWELREISQLPNGNVTLRLCLPDSPQAALLPKFTLEYWVTIGKKITLELVVANVSPDQELVCETCLHSYFVVGDISAVSIAGLGGAEYLDKTQSFARKKEASEAITFSAETDRIYLDAAGPVDIFDTKLQRRIHIEKTNSLSTVVWNPWAEKAQQMADFGNEDFRQMVCVESGNVGENKITVAPGKSSRMQVEISTGAI